MIRLLLAALFALGATLLPAAAHPAPPVTILISIDGFRADYLQRGVTPNLSALAHAGASGAMRPAFPSKTFPNHWTMVTGLSPDHHGIVANRMIDPEGKRPPFALTTEDPWWWQGGEPVWLAASRAGIRTASEFWPGAGVEGRRADDWNRFDPRVPPDARVDAVLDWMRRPARTRPRFVALYFEAVDSAGHQFGPDAPEVDQAAAMIDRAVGRLRRGLANLRLRANLVIVSDHGMAALATDRVIDLRSFAPEGDWTAVEDGPYAGLNAVPGHEAALATALARSPPHVRCWPKAAIPARFRYGHNPRIPQFLCLADPGWLVLAKPPTSPVRGGNHGYDNAAPEMQALFIGHGPAFRPGVRLNTFDNLAVEPLLRRLIGLPPGATRDGTLRPVRRALRNR